MLAEIAAAAGNSDRAAELVTEIGTLDRTAEDQSAIAAELRTVTDLQSWLADKPRAHTLWVSRTPDIAGVRLE
ncbi:hypothetical protein ACGFNT_16850 [Nocardia iowensis]